jgi:CBS domain containing-hemolysin-like protein
VLTLLGWVAVAVLIGANALFVAAEFALTSVDRSKVTRLAGEGDRRAKNVLVAVRELSFQLSGAQLGITICSLLLGFVAEPVIATALESMFHWFGLPAGAVAPVSLVLALGLATIAQMLFGELVPQNLALARPLAVARAIVPLQRGFTRICRPIISVFNNTANAIVRALGVKPEEELRSARTPAELSHLFGSSVERGLLPQQTAVLLNRVLGFADKTAEEVMTPRVQVVALRIGQSAQDMLDLSRSSGRSRFPVYASDLDDIVGVVHIKQAFGIPAEQRSDTTMEGLLRPPLHVPATLKGDALLNELRGDEFQLAVVIDEYGGTAGVVTTEDLVEELVGQVVDEHDASEVPEVLALPDGSWSVSGRLHKDTFSEFGFDITGGHYDTIAGLVLEQLGRIPDAGESAVLDGWTLIVTRVEGHRIERVLLMPPDEGPPADDVETS